MTTAVNFPELPQVLLHFRGGMHVKTLRELGMPLRYVKAISDLMDGDNGLLILCGPTGSGKTTTIYSILRSIDALKNNVLTAKSPIEVLLENISQTQIDDDGVQLRDLGPRNPTSGARHRDDVSAIRSS